MRPWLAGGGRAGKEREEGKININRRNCGGGAGVERVKTEAIGNIKLV